MNGKMTSGTRAVLKGGGRCYALLPFHYHPPCPSNYTRWEPLEPALMDARAVIAVKKEGTYHVDDNNIYTLLYTHAHAPMHIHTIITIGLEAVAKSCNCLVPFAFLSAFQIFFEQIYIFMVATNLNVNWLGSSLKTLRIF